MCTQPESTVTSLDAALGLYELAHYEWLREPVHDMNCLLAWNKRMLVVAFRGTASLANIKSDAKARVGSGPLVRELALWHTATDALSYTCAAVLALGPPAQAWIIAVVLAPHGARRLPGQLAGAEPEAAGERQARLVHASLAA